MNVNLNPVFRRILGTDSGSSLLSRGKFGSGKAGWQGRDLFVKAKDEFDIYETYSAAKMNKGRYISQKIMDIANNNISTVVKEGNVYKCNGVTFLASQIPPIRGGLLNEVKAQNNTINFGKNQYFKYVSKDGSEHYLYASDKGIGSIFTEHLRGVPQDETLERYAEFWRRMMADDPVLYQTYNKSQVDEYMEEAGIEHGFFTVKMGDREATQFYTASKYTSTVEAKWRYDAEYENLTSGGQGTMRSYEPGTVWKFGGHEYVMNESHTFDIPYGEDIFDVGYPENYRFGVKIE